jgi:hypothetical protein
MHGAADAVGFKIFFQVIAARMADDETMIRALGVAGFVREL